MFKRPSDGLFAGLFVGILAVTVLMALHVDVNNADERQIKPIITSEAAAASFVNAWQQMAEGTWAVKSTYVRTLNSGRSSQSEVFEAQDEEDYVRSAFGSTVVRLNGRSYSCTSTADNKVTGCRDTGGAADTKTVAAQSVANVSSLVVGDQRMYDVARSGDDCYDLYARPTLKTLPWGTQAQFCFDSKTGAMTGSEFHWDEGVDVTTATDVTGSPESSAFEVSRG